MQKNYICGVVFMLFLGAAAIFALMSVFSSSQPSFNKASVLHGEWTKAYEKEFDENLGHQKASRSLWNSAGYVLFGEGKKGVLIGQDGWLFTNEEFLKGNEADNFSAHHKGFILSTAEELSKSKVKLLIVLIPSKARIHQDQLGRYEFPSYWSNQYQDLLKFLKPHKIPVVDLLTAFENNKFEGLYLKTDTHWTPIGARLTAMQVESSIAYNFPYVSWFHQLYKSSKGDYIEHEGDLMRYTASGDLFGVVKDKFYTWKTEKVGGDDTSGDNLFGDVSLPITLVGTSYSANKLWNFEGFLKEMLATDILNVADKGLGPFEVMKNYIQSDIYKNNSPKLVIWEIPERYLSMKSKNVNESK